jgi:hypothetical protein
MRLSKVKKSRYRGRHIQNLDASRYYLVCFGKNIRLCKYRKVANDFTDVHGNGSWDVNCEYISDIYSVDDDRICE